MLPGLRGATRHREYMATGAGNNEAASALGGHGAVPEWRSHRRSQRCAMTRIVRSRLAQALRTFARKRHFRSATEVQADHVSPRCAR